MADIQRYLSAFCKGFPHTAAPPTQFPAKDAGLSVKIVQISFFPFFRRSKAHRTGFQGHPVDLFTHPS